MGRMYTATFNAVSCTAVQDFFEVQPADDKPVTIHGYSFAQTGVADVGDAAEELLQIVVRRGYTTTGSGGTTPTPTALVASEGAASTVVEANNTTPATTGTIVDISNDAFNVRIPYVFWYTPETRPTCVQGVFLVIRLLVAPADAITLSGTLYFEEA